MTSENEKVAQSEETAQAATVPPSDVPQMVRNNIRNEGNAVDQETWEKFTRQVVEIFHEVGLDASGTDTLPADEIARFQLDYVVDAGTVSNMEAILNERAQHYGVQGTWTGTYWPVTTYDTTA